MLALLISVVILVSGIFTMIAKIMGLDQHQDEGEQEEAIEQLASGMQQMEGRLDRHDAQLEVLEGEVLEKLR